MKNRLFFHTMLTLLFGLLTHAAEPVVPRWEADVQMPKLAERKLWSQFTRDFIDHNAPALVEGPKDVTSFCPHYFEFNRDQRLDFWVYFMSSISELESSFVPTDSTPEYTLGYDAVTHNMVRSEGLMQVSYQDSHYPYCNKFRWNEDQNKDPSDSSKSIFDYKLNLSCGIGIINFIAQNTHLLVVSDNTYYDVLRERETNWGEDILPLDQIRDWTNSLKICKNGPPPVATQPKLTPVPTLTPIPKPNQQQTLPQQPNSQQQQQEQSQKQTSTKASTSAPVVGGVATTPVTAPLVTFPLPPSQTEIKIEPLPSVLPHVAH